MYFSVILSEAKDLIAVTAHSVSTESPHPEEHRGAVRLEGWDAVVMLPTTARGLLRAIETGVEFTPRYSRGALLRVRCGVVSPFRNLL
jgi:hypothetical protein